MASIVVPLDGSQLAEEAIPWAAQLARARGDALHFVSVSGWEQALWEDAHIDPGAVLHGVRAQLTSYLEQLVRRPDVQGIALSHEVRNGDVATEIEKALSEQQGGLVVITTHGRGGFDGSGRGSVADRLVRTLKAPVVVIRPHLPEAKIEALLVPLDGSTDSQLALTVGRELAARLGAMVHLLAVVDPGLTWNWPEADRASASQHLYQRAEAYLQELHQSGEVTVVVVGDPAEAIVEHARTRGCDLIAMATHGRSGSARLELGSVADSVARRADRPVLLVPIGR